MSRLIAVRAIVWRLALAAAVGYFGFTSLKGTVEAAIPVLPFLFLVGTPVIVGWLLLGAWDYMKDLVRPG